MIEKIDLIMNPNFINQKETIDGIENEDDEEFLRAKVFSIQNFELLENFVKCFKKNLALKKKIRKKNLAKLFYCEEVFMNPKKFFVNY